MILIPPPNKKCLFSLALSAAIATGAVFTVQPAARAENPFSRLAQRVRLLINPPPEQKPVGRVRGGAGRGMCPPVDHQVAALVPFAAQDPDVAAVYVDEAALLGHVGGKTNQASPTFWFYVPYSSEEIATAEFMVLDAELEPVDEAVMVPLTQTPGFVRVDVPTELAVNQHYNWYFSVICDQIRPSRNPGVHGWIERTNVAVDVDVETQSLQEQYRAYAEAELWHEMFTTLMQARIEHPQDTAIAEDWQVLLASLGLSAIANEPVAECCTLAAEETMVAEDLGDSLVKSSGLK